MFGLDADTLRNIKKVFATLPNLEKVILYGSRAKGNYKDGSDIDITLRIISVNSIFFRNNEKNQEEAYPVPGYLRHICSQ
jgi:predicted nucleotidyltransferase